MAEQETFWEGLFAGEPLAGAPCTVPMRLVRKAGRPWLLLPVDGRLAASVLELYPAQTLRARLGRTILKILLRARLPVGTEAVPVAVPPAAGFVRFLASLERPAMRELPPFGVLAGNPATPGRRFILVVFDHRGEPAAVVKAGLSERARELIRREQAFLADVPKSVTGIPAIRGSYERVGLLAFALDFYTGSCPGAQDEDRLSRLLSSWVNKDKELLISQTRVWHELNGSCGQHPIFPALLKKLEGRALHPAITHGDLAPWNIKVQADGSWMVLDWERGEREGIPAWDWFHYSLQPAILVEHSSVDSLIQLSERFLGTPRFAAYAKRAGITGLERTLCLAYLLHHTEVVRPSEGLVGARDLLTALVTRWQTRSADF
ncbi:MAG TPA: hypothetical protein VN578_07050 [Candidatus Binatia bacterium]|jgi:hypothetical protein|nr:hypothetical protein [Candidatus Binatia bacterium]